MMRVLRRFFSPRITSLATLVALLAVLLYFDLVTKPETDSYSVRRVSNTVSSTRAPASIAEVPQSTSSFVEPDRITTIEWNCEDASSIQSLKNITQVRLSGSCLKDVKTITNKNNGYTANIFRRESEFTTDYVTLESGTNKLEMKAADGATGNLLQKLEIIVEKQ